MTTIAQGAVLISDFDASITFTAVLASACLKVKKENNSHGRRIQNASAFCKQYVIREKLINIFDYTAENLNLIGKMSYFGRAGSAKVAVKVSFCYKFRTFITKPETLTEILLKCLITKLKVFFFILSKKNIILMRK